MRDHRIFSHQTLAHQLEFVHELGEQTLCLGEMLGFSERMEIDSELAHFPYPKIGAGSIQLIGNPSQSPPITLLERVL